MKKGRKHKQKEAQPPSRKPEAKSATTVRRIQESPADRAARQERRKQEKAQCAVQCQKYIKRLQEQLLQPSRKHYGGLGYAKESIFVQLDDPEYAELFQEIWDEHIPGFSGKSFKRRKSEASSNMLWRQRLKARQEGVAAPSVDTIVAASSGVDVVKAQHKAPAATAAMPSKQSRKGSNAGKVAAAASASPDLQAQVMAAYRNMKLKQREADKKGAKGSKNR